LYESDIDKKPRYFLVSCRFIASKDYPIGIAIDPAQVDKHEGDQALALAPRMTAEDFANTLKLPIGTINIVFPEKKPDGTANFISMGAAGKLLVFDPASMNVIFSTTFPNRKSKSLSAGLHHVEKGMHILFITWNDEAESIGLTIDGTETTEK
jgi:hypothetical protein